MGWFPWYVWALGAGGLIVAAMFLPAFAVFARAANAMLGIVPALVWVILLVFALGAAGVERSQLVSLKATVKADKQAQIVKDAEVKIAAAEQATKVEAAYAANLKTQLKAQNASITRDQIIKSNAAAVRSERYGLRDTTSAFVAKNTGAADRERTLRLAAVFGDCAREYEEMAITADQLNRDRRLLLESWPR